MNYKTLSICTIALSTIALTPVSHATKDNSIIIQSTTSTANSGLYDYLLPKFKTDTGIVANVVAVGTGQAIKNAKNCDGDVLLVHAKTAEQQFVAEGYGVERFDLMYNDFIIVGPPSDPAGIKGSNNVLDAFSKIANSEALFASRGDNSGTHKKERSLWAAASVDPTQASGKWYRETGSGMGATLNVAVGMDAYTMTDRATWISFKNKGNFTIAAEGDKALFNQYGVILVNEHKCPNVKADLGQKFVNWLLSTRGQTEIGTYEVDGQKLFFSNAH